MHDESLSLYEGIAPMIEEQLAGVLKLYINNSLNWDQTLEVLEAMFAAATDPDEIAAMNRFVEMVSQGMLHGITAPSTVH